MNEFINIADPVGAATLEAVSGAARFNHWMYQQIRPFLQGRVLEIGSGTGNISTFIVRDGFDTVLSDYQQKYLDLLSKKFSPQLSAKQIIRIDLQDPQFASTYASLQGSFDSICMLNVIEHLQDDLAAVANCRFLLKEKGLLVLLAPAYSFLYCDLDKNLGHYRRYTTQTLSLVCTSNKFRLLKKRYFNVTGIAGWLLSGKLLGAQQLKPGQMKLFDALMPFVKLADKICCHQVGLSAIVVAQKSFE